VVTGSHPPGWCDSDRRSAESIFARGAGAFHSGTSSNSAVRKLILQFDSDEYPESLVRETCFKSFLVDLGFGPGERRLKRAVVEPTFHNVSFGEWRQWPLLLERDHPACPL
jgi:hypothetical protein